MLRENKRSSSSFWPIVVSPVKTQTTDMTTCAKCSGPLEIEVGLSDESDVETDGPSQDHATETVPDDVHLPCGCHFHWECLLDSYEVETCPVCSRSIVSNLSSSSTSDNPTQQIIVDLTNEGGLQRQIDIFPIVKEESYLRAYPEERKCRAFLEFCREGDHPAIVDLLQSADEQPQDDDIDVDAINGEDVSPQKTADEILRYQDPIGEMQSGLHAAAANGNREVAWLLLLLASNLPELDFPALVFQEAASLGMMREDQEGKVDIRILTDAHGRTAEDVAREFGVVWNGWIGNGRLAMP